MLYSSDKKPRKSLDNGKRLEKRLINFSNVNNARTVFSLFSLLKRQINPRNMLFLQQSFDFMLVFCFVLWTLFCFAFLCRRFHISRVCPRVWSVVKFVNKKGSSISVSNRETFSQFIVDFFGRSVFGKAKVFYRWNDTSTCSYSSRENDSCFVGVKRIFFASKLKVWIECLMRVVTLHSEPMLYFSIGNLFFNSRKGIRVIKLWLLPDFVFLLTPLHDKAFSSAYTGANGLFDSNEVS